jgi:hypothetical protein
MCYSTVSLSVYNSFRYFISTSIVIGHFHGYGQFNVVASKWICLHTCTTGQIAPRSKVYREFCGNGCIVYISHTLK